MTFRYAAVYEKMTAQEKKEALAERRDWVNSIDCTLSTHRKSILLSLLNYADNAFKQNILTRIFASTKKSRYDIFNSIFEAAIHNTIDIEKDKQFFNAVEAAIMQIGEENSELRNNMIHALTNERRYHLLALQKDPHSSVSEANQGYQNLLIGLYLIGLGINGLDSTGFALLTATFSGAYYYFFSDGPNQPSRAAKEIYRSEELTQRGQQINQVLYPINLFPRALTLFGRATNTALTLGHVGLSLVETKAKEMEVQYANPPATIMMTELPSTPTLRRRRSEDEN